MSMDIDAGVSQVSQELRRLRDKAGIKKIEMAKELGMPVSSYQHYEDKHKERYFDTAFVLKILPILTKRGIDPEDVIALAPPHPMTDYAVKKLDELVTHVDSLGSELAHLKRALKPNS